MIRTALAGLLALPLVASAADPAPKAGTPLEFVVLPDGAPARLEVRIEVDGKPLSAVWDDTFAKLTAYFDRDGNGSLDEKEAARLPDPVALRQSIGTGFTPPIGVSPTFTELDTDNNGKVTPGEVAAYYKKAGLGSALVGVGRMPHGAELTAALLARIDADKDGKTTEAEWKAASASLAKLDANDDELIGVGELVPKANYPGASGSTLLSATPGEISALDARFAFPMVLLPVDPADTRWATEWVRRRQPVTKPTADDLVATRKAATVGKWVVRLGEKQPASERLGLTVGNIRIDGNVSDGKLPALASGVRKQLTASLNGKAEEPAEPAGGGGRRRQGGGIGWLTPLADRNDDGKLDKAELDAWLDLQDQITRGHVLVTLLDGGSLFEILDTNHDGALSVRELRTAWDRLKATGCVADGTLDAKKVSRIVLASVSRGYPMSTETRHGPAWFQAMDRNRDGDVSRKEFTGDPEAFDKLDADKDGLLSPEEASRAGK